MNVKKNWRELPEYKHISLKVTLRLTDPAPLRDMMLRVNDSQFEVFQFAPVRREKNSEDKEVFIYNIEEGCQRSNWGAKINNKFDGKLYFCGLSLVYDKNVQSGKVTFIDVEVFCPGGNEVVALDQLCGFDPEKNLYEQQIFGGAAALELHDNMLHISGRARQVNFIPYRLRLDEVMCPEKINVKLNCLSGKGEFGFVIKDLAGKSYTISAPFGQGRQTLRIPLPNVSSSKISYQWFFIKNVGDSLDVDIQSVYSETSKKGVEAVSVNIETGNGFHLLPVGNEKDLYIIFNNHSDQTLVLNVKLCFQDYFNHSFNESLALNLNPGTDYRYQIRHAIPYQGIWNVDCTFIDPATKGTATQGKTLVYTIPAGITDKPSAGNFLFGVCTHLPRWSKAEQTLSFNALTACGTKLIRTSIGWDSIQPAPDTWHFDQFDQLVKDVSAHGMVMDFTLHPTPRWAALPERRSGNYWIWSRSPAIPGVYGTYAGRMAERGKGTVRFWEIGNEPDLIKNLDPQDYIRMMREAYAAIKKVDPSAYVINGGFTAVEHPGIQKGFQETVIRDGKGYYDFHAFHQHGGFGQFSSIIDGSFAEVRRKNHVEVPWFPNETAVHSAGGTEKTQAETLFKKITVQLVTRCYFVCLVSAA